MRTSKSISGNTNTAPSPGASSTISRSTADRRPTVLVMEDTHTIRYAVELMLELNGYRVLSAADGLEGLSLFRRHIEEIALVISDVEMPQMNGIQAVHAMQRLKPGQQVIFMSARLPEDRNDLQGIANILAEFGKPFDLKQMVKVVKQNLPAPALL